MVVLFFSSFVSALFLSWETGDQQKITHEEVFGFITALASSSSFAIMARRQTNFKTKPKETAAFREEVLVFFSVNTEERTTRYAYHFRGDGIPYQIKKE